ncbi:MAG: rod shape-determining protein MreC [Deltaproteobacteria bacterium]|nr:rod shape-determining protein MreC [Deltaproteobacteria bacterium]
MRELIFRYRVILCSVLLCLLSLHLISKGRSGSGGVLIVSRAITSVVNPINYSFSTIKNSLTSILDNYVLLLNIKETNQALLLRVDKLSKENNRLKEEEALHSRLKKLISFKENTPTKTITASVLSISSLQGSGGWTRVITLSKGKADTIEKNMPVMSPGGVLGRITDVSTHNSKGLMLIDPRSNIDVIIQRTRVRGIAEGNGTDITLKYVRDLEDVRIGDVIVTAGLSGVFPKGLKVGEVTQVQKGWDNFFKSIVVRPSADLERLEEALILTGISSEVAEQENAEKIQKNLTKKDLGN